MTAPQSVSKARGLVCFVVIVSVALYASVYMRSRITVTLMFPPVACVYTPPPFAATNIVTGEIRTQVCVRACARVRVTYISIYLPPVLSTNGTIFYCIGVSLVNDITIISLLLRKTISCLHSAPFAVTDMMHGIVYSCSHAHACALCQMRNCQSDYALSIILIRTLYVWRLYLYKGINIFIRVINKGL